MVLSIPDFIQAIRWPTYQLEFVANFFEAFPREHARLLLAARRAGYRVRQTIFCAGQSLPLRKRRWFCQSIRHDTWDAMTEQDQMTIPTLASRAGAFLDHWKSIRTQVPDRVQKMLDWDPRTAHFYKMHTQDVDI